MSNTKKIPPAYVGFGMLTPVTIMVLDRLPKHNTGALVREFSEFVYDDAAIIACVLRQWGVPTGMIGTAVGDDPRGHALAAQLSEWGVQGKVRFSKDIKTPIEVNVSDKTGARTYFWHRPPEMLATLDTADLSLLDGARLMYVDWYDGERIVRAMSQSIIDHRGPKFAALVGEILAGLRGVFQAEHGHPILYPGSGTGGWEAAVVNTLSPGDRVLGVVNGHFSNHFCRTAAAHGIEVDRLEVPYGAGVPADRVGERLRTDQTHQIRAVLDPLKTAGLPLSGIKVDGGLTRSRYFLQLQANALRTSLHHSATDSAAAFGAALMAGLGAGVWGSLGELRRLVPAGEVVHPDPASAEKLDESYAAWLKAIDTLVAAYGRPA